MFCLIPEVLRLLKITCSLCKGPRCFIIKVLWHDFGFSTRLMIFSIVPAIFNILGSFELIPQNSIGSVGSVVKYINDTHIGANLLTIHH